VNGEPDKSSNSQAPNGVTATAEAEFTMEQTMSHPRVRTSLQLQKTNPMFTNLLSARLSRALIVTGALLAAGAIVTAETVRFAPVPNSSKLRMDGTSTIHDWHAETDIIGGYMELDATFADGKSAPVAVKPNVEVKIPVRSLKSSGGKRMDAVMQEHMKFAQFKTIEYKVLELNPKAGAAGQYEAKGTLTVAGVTKTNVMPVTIERVDKKLKVTGTTALKMTDHGIKPPAPEIAGISLIRTGDEVKLKFEWVTEPKAP
jgi:polyisoprenoid-binding protein YceI